MPIGGVVISCKPEDCSLLSTRLTSIAGLEVHGSDDKGNIVAVLETRTTDDMEALVKQVTAIETVLHVGLTYLNAEDEAGLIAEGAYTPQVFGRRKGEKLQE